MYQLLEKNGKFFVNSDDFQVLTDVMLCSSRLEEAIKTMEKRQLLNIVSSLSNFNKDYIETFKDDPFKLANFIYDKLMLLIINGAVTEMK